MMKGDVPYPNWKSFGAKNELAAKRLNLTTIRTRPMNLRPDAHPGKNDCLHWCLPGTLDIVGDIVLRLMLQEKI